MTKQALTIALAGNPNSGKTTLFNQLTGANQYIGNWPGVTVEKKEGKLKGHPQVTIQDLPGIYSLSANSLEERIASEQLTQHSPDAIINIVDGTNLERNLYLTMQILEMGIPTVVAINMADMLSRQGAKLDLDKLSKRLGCPVVGISALKGTHINELIAEALKVAKSGQAPKALAYKKDFEKLLSDADAVLGSDLQENQRRYWLTRALENPEPLNLKPASLDKLSALVKSYEEKEDDDIQSLITFERYALIDQVVEGVRGGKAPDAVSTSDKIDRIVTNRWLALPIFVVVMTLVFGLSVWSAGPGTFLTDWVNESLFGDIIPPAVESLLVNWGVADWLQSLILDGIIAGVGAVLGFLPQMVVLFLVLAFLEGTGYMARVAFIMDRLFRRFGLSGKSFIPMLVGVGCSVPGIMASRTIEEERDRRMTVTVTSFIPCGAKLPIIALIAGALFGGAWWVAPSAYFLGIAAVIISGIILKKTKPFAGPPAPFVMELPPYRWPAVGTVLRSVWERAWSFVRKAGTVILLSSIVIWVLSSLGWENGSFGLVEDVENGLMAKLGGAIAWIFKPLGFGNWRAAVATITGLVAKENVVSTYGVLYGIGEVSEAGEEIWHLLARDFTTVSAYAFLIFNLICVPCFAAIGAIKREMNSARWTWFAIGYQTVFAYVLALVYYQLGTWFTTGAFTVGTVFGIIALVGLLYMIFRRQKDYQKSVVSAAPAK